PPTAPHTGAVVASVSGWATGLGIVVLVYATLGILVNAVGLAMLVYSEQAREAAGGLDVAKLALGGVAMLLGVVLAIGALGLLKRRRFGVHATLTWAAARLVLLLVAGTYGWLTLPAQVDQQMELMDRRIAEARGSSGGGSRSVTISVGGGGGLDREAMLRWSKLMFVGSILVIGAMPVATAWILTNRRRREEIAGW
ncbi:MAG: hypothetical protein ACO3NL_05855, partial [Phycisphaerales bacterium]